MLVCKVMDGPLPEQKREPIMCESRWFGGGEEPQLGGWVVA